MAKFVLPHEGRSTAGMARIVAPDFHTSPAGHTDLINAGDHSAIYRRPHAWSGISTFRAHGTMRHRLVGEPQGTVDRDVIDAAINERLAELRNAAADEEIAWSSPSEQGFREFIDRTRTTAPPFLTLRPDGNLRALWERSGGDQIGLQFLNRFRIGYVLFVVAPNGEIDRHYGTAGRSQVTALIRHLQLHPLLVR